MSFRNKTYLPLLQDISLLLTMMDQDRHCGAVEMGHTTITLKDAKQTVEDPVKFSTEQFIKQTKKVIV